MDIIYGSANFLPGHLERREGRSGIGNLLCKNGIYDKDSAMNKAHFNVLSRKAPNHSSSSFW